MILELTNISKSFYGLKNVVKTPHIKAIFYDDFIPKGKTGLREYKKSAWCKKNTAASALDDLLKSAKFSQIFLSYNNEGIISPDEIRKIMSKHGKYECFTKKYRRFKADSKREHKANSVVEYLHFLEKI